MYINTNVGKYSWNVSIRQATIALAEWESAQATVHKNNNNSKQNQISTNTSEDDDTDEDKNALLSMLKSFSQVRLRCVDVHLMVFLCVYLHSTYLKSSGLNYFDTGL